MTYLLIIYTDFEKELDRKLASDDFDEIAEAITPKSLGACSTNTLLKAFEVPKGRKNCNAYSTRTSTTVGGGGERVTSPAKDCSK